MEKSTYAFCRAIGATGLTRPGARYLAPGALPRALAGAFSRALAAGDAGFGLALGRRGPVGLGF